MTVLDTRHPFDKTSAKGLVFGKARFLPFAYLRASAHSLEMTRNESCYSLKRVSSFWIFSISSFFVLQAMQNRARGLTCKRLISISTPHSSHRP
jgi:hypothetical protein